MFSTGKLKHLSPLAGVRSPGRRKLQKAVLLAKLPSFWLTTGNFSVCARIPAIVPVVNKAGLKSSVSPT